jgi:site-specific DNA-cytosine methylase
MKSMQRSEAVNRSTKKNKIIIDLCSGSGSATGIWQNSGYEVYRYDIVRLENAPYTHLRDLSDPDQCRSIIKDHQDHDVLLIWASPPCPEYSHANQKTNDPLFVPNTMIWRNCQAIIDHLDPDHHVIENVKGAMRTWGKPRQKCGPYYLWGSFPIFNIPKKIPPKGVRGLGRNGIRPDYRIANMKKDERSRHVAKIPYMISEGLYRAIVLQKTLLPPPF